MYVEQLKSGNFRYQMTYIDELTGKRKRVSCTLPKNTDKARREAEKILVGKIRTPSSSDATFGEVSESFYKAHKDVWRAGTCTRYSFSLNALKTALGADTRVSKLTARYVMEGIREAKPRAATRNELLRSFKTVMRWAYKNDYLDDIKWLDKLERFPEPTIREKNKEKYLERDELAKLLPELKIDLERYLISFLALSGLRIGEALALQKDDIDGRTIHVTKTLNLQTRTIQEGAKTYSSNRDVWIQDELFELCKDIRKYMMKTSMLCGFRSEFFFCDFEGRPLQYDRVNKYFRENCERVIGRRLSLHSLRHTHASLMFEGGASLESVSLRLGHSDSLITKQIYLHVTDRLKDQYNETFNQIRILS